MYAEKYGGGGLGGGGGVVQRISGAEASARRLAVNSSPSSCQLTAAHMNLSTAHGFDHPLIFTWRYLLLGVCSGTIWSDTPLASLRTDHKRIGGKLSRCLLVVSC